MTLRSLLLLSSFALVASISEDETSSLQMARNLQAPVPKRTLGGELEEVEFWETNTELLRKAWKEYEDPKTHQFNTSISELFHEPQRKAIESAWLNPELNEEGVRQLWKPIAPDVFVAQLLNPEQIHQIRYQIDLAKASGIPTRRPNGMNRHGIIVDPETDGAVHSSPLVAFYEELADRFVRPIGRLLFPDYVGGKHGDDVESYLFTVQYHYDKDRILREHTDASLITFNINLNLEDEHYDYGANPHLHFSGADHAQANFTFSPGMAVIHRGMKRHQAYPILEGQRTNMIVWIFGRDGFVRAFPYAEDELLSPRQRWSLPNEMEKDSEADLPFRFI